VEFEETTIFRDPQFTILGVRAYILPWLNAFGLDLPLLRD
jgi:hypothetical protein